ncbi:MAG: twin-arginine translocation signal domain-containing protein [Ferruginibacter sp.]
MENNILKQPTHRRGFITRLAAGAAAMGFASLASPLVLKAGTLKEKRVNLPEGPADEWFAKIKGKHRIVFDATHPKEIFPFAWPRVFLMTNEATGSPAKDCGVVVILRHEAIPYAFEDKLWAKYKFGEMFSANDPATKAPSIRNPFWKPEKGAFKIPGIGEVAIGINELQDSGVMFCVCNAAMTVYSAAVAEKMGLAAADVKKEWMDGLLPGVQPVPSGVWAVGRAQEHGCAYCAIP